MLNLKNFQEFYDAVEMGLDIEFFIDGIRYNISWQNNKPFICVCPDVLRRVFVGTRLKAAEPRVAHKPCLSVIDQLVENCVLRVGHHKLRNRIFCGIYGNIYPFGILQP